jgi:hypothetical protein
VEVVERAHPPGSRLEPVRVSLEVGGERRGMTYREFVVACRRAGAPLLRLPATRRAEGTSEPRPSGS